MVLLSLALAGCGGDHSILDPAGPAARGVAWLWWGMLTAFTLVFLMVVGLWLAAFRRRGHPVRSAAQERRLGLGWILGGGILLPGVSILLLLAVGVPAGQRLLPLPGVEAPRVIEVIGHQWWWEVRYPHAEGEVVTANHLAMPAGEPVDFHVTGADVIHAFWVPRLGGKIDMLPGRVNRIRLEADEPGVFGAQCAEFCGAQHAHMQLHVEAMERDDFAAWLEARRRPPPQAEGHDTAREAFGEHCARCHRVEGLAEGTGGPDLSDIGSRATLGAGVLALEEGAIARWLAEHQTLKPGNRMPAHDHLDAETLEALGAWLETLRP
ncbi:cytochrome c oxidase subunit II [Halomonas heilongjiangensis]|uniref:Cytochrome aa3 subunit 2 n=1 Tax=Halomonas heilongjiangensis TaxID=1387883 RepID=A0A2N7TQC2_9GAMM|nr:cytochrome c oxidase subunit II [Halomonas heilongjiangensis]PMR70379.1 cytochrome c oxidase subunit II [Halomonas heilongjiangensis]PXX87639.1 cytochrome c oxidase subunit II [Halomonas heilongjiangensis]